jgi:cysteinyl-tRNA synthetase
VDPVPLFDQILEAEQEFTDAMDDDFNTPRALAALFNLTKGINVALRNAESATERSPIHGIVLAGETLRKLGSVLGGLFEGLEQSVSYIGGMGRSVGIIDVLADQELIRQSIESGQPLPKDVVNRIVEYRNQKRDQKDWATADAIRDWLADIGVIVDDTIQGARWYVRTTDVKTHQP